MYVPIRTNDTCRSPSFPTRSMGDSQQISCQSPPANFMPIPHVPPLLFRLVVLVIVSEKAKVLGLTLTIYSI